MSDINDFDSPSSSHNTQSVEATDEPISGWLLLLGVGIALTPIAIGLITLRDQIPWFVDGDWQLITSPETEDYDPLLACVVMFELVCNIAFIVGYVRLTTLFFRKSKVAPRFYIMLSTLHLGFVVIDTYLAWLSSTGSPLLDFETLRMLVFQFSSTAIWGSYILTSERVTKTFVLGKRKRHADKHR